MKYNIKIQNFEGPFDLLLRLVTTQKLDIGTISITEVIDQYLQQVAHMQQVDLDVASDFMLVAATLLKIKSDLILKARIEEDDEDLDEMEPSELQEELVRRLLIYKQFKDASTNLGYREDLQNRLFERNCGPDFKIEDLNFDFASEKSANDLGRIAAKCLSARDEFLLSASHIASKPIPVVTYVKTIHARLQNKHKMKFSELIDGQATTQVVVVNFLALLELYKHNYVDLSQKQGSEINIKFIKGSGELDLNMFDLEI